MNPGPYQSSKLKHRQIIIAGLNCNWASVSGPHISCSVDDCCTYRNAGTSKVMHDTIHVWSCIYAQHAGLSQSNPFFLLFFLNAQHTQA